MRESADGLNKRQIAASFSKAAASYDGVADLQRRVGRALLDRLPTIEPVQRWLDIGCGTGYFSRMLGQRYPKAWGTGLDLAEGMVRYAAPQGGARGFVCADAEHLPFIDQQHDLFFSSLALQWCMNFKQVVCEAGRVLRSGGVMAFSSLGTQTLTELRASWQAVDGQVHVNRFRSLEAYRDCCEHRVFDVLQLESRLITLHYPDVGALTHELKALGAHNVNQGRPEGLTGRARIRAMMQAYEGFRQPQGLPAQWEVIYGVLRRR